MITAIIIFVTLYAIFNVAIGWSIFWAILWLLAAGYARQ